jgi:putative protease
MELLAPAGDIQKLKAAIEAGADAVYLAGNQFGARSFAGNFEKEALVEAIAYCHLLGKKAYVTVNTLIKSNEWPDCMDFIDFLYKAQVDAVIVQDFGVLAYIQNRYPDLAKHASTQMTLYTEDGLDFAHKFGIERVVLAREVELSTVSQLSKHSDVKTEVFVHGALCYAVSGQCLMSSMIGGRSGNRGKCAQTCRKAYSTELNKKPYGKPGFLLSMKDLNTLDHVSAFQEAGVSALKIEGRMRSPEYVSTTVSAYRKAIDDAIKPWDMAGIQQTLTQAFNREYTKGYILSDKPLDIVNARFSSNQGVYLGTTQKNANAFYLTLVLEETLRVGDKLKIVDTDREYGIEVFNMYQHKQKRDIAHAGETVEIDFNNLIKNVCKVYKTYDYSLNLKMKAQSELTDWRVCLDMTVVIQKNQLPKLILKDRTGHEVIQLGEEPVSEALKAPLSEEAILQQLSKLNDTVYLLGDVTVELEEGCFMPVKSLNALRRTAVEALNTIRINPYEARKAPKYYQPSEPREVNKRTGYEFLYYAHTTEQLDALVEHGVKTVYYYDVLALDQVRSQYDLTLYPALKAFYTPTVWQRIKKVLKDEAVISVANAGQCEAFKDALLTLDTGFNFTNYSAIDFFNEHYSVQRAFVSHELNEAELEHLVRNVPQAGVYFKGRPLIMSTLSCPAKVAAESQTESCGQCLSGQFELIDEKEARYPFKCLYGTTNIYHHATIQMDAILHEWAHKAFRYLKVELTTETYEDSKALLQTHDKLGYLGHLYRGVE